MLKVLKSEHPINGTGDLVPEAQIKRDVKKIIDVVYDGGVAILPLDVAYAIVGCTEDAIKRIFTAKNRSYEKPSGLFSIRRQIRPGLAIRLTNCAD